MLIGLHGKKQAGKDTVHQRITTLFPDFAVERRSFADRLYRSAAAALGVTVDELQRWKTDPAVCVVVERRLPGRRGLYAEQTVREYLQRYGTEAHRDVFGSDFWVDQLDLEHADKIVVVTDVRFPNEAERVRAAGGTVVQVIGPADVEQAGDGHASETPLPEALVDEYLLNDERNDGFCHLDAQVVDLVQRLETT